MDAGAHDRGEGKAGQCNRVGAGAVTEGLDAVQGLRASTVQRNDLAHATSTLGQELKNDPMMITNSDCVCAMMGKE